ncbi:hypothetical protein O0I10_012974 [Lichtheimia ornata]|uniref:Uncharacterized protein n=1 Tax=Lichtheimia ornata TaxID=688661 RepID=A0AAD7UR25_9FUNG|nr:uncharacterized protein O0I10_012974 [Lichtheimia ornata]KAJ8651466.1 hypothetical protein O0I10_012974 [Lichtheimia ornata]
MANPIELEDEDQHLNWVGVSQASKRSLSYSCGCQGYRFHGLEISYLQVVSLSVDFQSNVFIGAMADLIPQVLVWIPWTFSYK